MFIQHPPEIPATILPLNGDWKAPQPDTEEFEQGITFPSEKAITPGTSIDIRITLRDQSIPLRGIVRWCSKHDTGYSIGVCFPLDSWFSARMIEQACWIDCYHRRRQQQMGCSIPREQAAQEWIQKHAASFPQLNG